jgi:ATP-binding cassette subfamily F protein uup
LLPVTGFQLPGEEEAKPTIGDQQPVTGNKRKASFKEKREFELLEKEIAELETERQQIQNQLSDAGAPYERLNLLSKRIGEISNLLNEKEMRWLELSEIM